MSQRSGKKREEGIREIAEELTPLEIKKGVRITRGVYKVVTNKNPPI